MAELDVASNPNYVAESAPLTAGAVRETNGAAPPYNSLSTPLRSDEAFANYCSQIQGRLKERAVARRQFLQSAYDRLTGLLRAALAVDDQPLYNELWQHRVAAKELLEAALRVTNSASAIESAPAASAPLPSAPAPSVSFPAPAAPPRPAPIENHVAPHAAPYENGSAPVPPAPYAAPFASNGVSAREETQPDQPPPFASGFAPSAPQDYNAPRLPRRPVRPLSDIEADAAALRNELRGWAKTHPLQTASKDLHIPNCLRLRAICCRQRRLEEEAGDAEMQEVLDLGEEIEKMLDDAGDQEYTVALDYEIEPMPTAYQWGELAERYDDMAIAFEAFIWWNLHWNELTVSEMQPLAESVAAIQQRFNRLLFRIGARDPFQQMLFDDLRVWAREAQCYLHSLRPKVPIAELIERAGGWMKLGNWRVSPSRRLITGRSRLITFSKWCRKRSSDSMANRMKRRFAPPCCGAASSRFPRRSAACATRCCPGRPCWKQTSGSKITSAKSIWNGNGGRNQIAPKNWKRSRTARWTT